MERVKIDTNLWKYMGGFSWDGTELKRLPPIDGPLKSRCVKLSPTVSQQDDHPKVGPTLLFWLSAGELFP